MSKITKNKTTSRQRLECDASPARTLPALSPPITHKEMLTVISEWSRCLRESHGVGGVCLPAELCPPEVQRELAVLRALAFIVRCDDSHGGHWRPSK